MYNVCRVSFVTLFIAIFYWGCKTSAPVASNSAAGAKTDPIIAYIGQIPVYRSEFLYVYDKNGGITDTSNRAKSIQDYLDLYVNFRLKVKEAESMGLDTLASFKQELSGYREQLADPYLVDSSVVRSLVREAYEHMKEEVKASHILITVPQDAPPEDTLKAYNQMLEIRQKAVGGQDFTALAREYSQDPSAKTNGGDLGYFTALQMVYPFEKAAYQTPKGSISPLIRTRFGYHILKVTDRRVNRGKITVAHIMVRINPEAPEAEAKAAKDKIDEIYKSLKKGENWDKLTADFSEDGNSRSKGGVLPPFGTGNTIPEFENAAFSLNNPGDLSQPVLTPYGWHIIKLIEKKGLETFTQQETALQQKVTKDSRSELNKKVLLDRLRKENNFVENAEARKWAMAQASEPLKKGNWTYNADEKNTSLTLFSVKNTAYPVKDFLEYVKAHQQPNEKFTPVYQMELLYKEFLEESLITYEKNHLEEKYPDFKYLVREYHDGILLFQRMESEVWSKSLSDSVGQKAYFEQNVSKYQWEKRVVATVYNAVDNGVLTQAKTMVAKKPYPVAEPKFTDLTFAKNISVLTDAQKEQLQSLLTTLTQDKSWVVEISGHADKGEKAGLSAARNKAVSDYLLQNGTDITQLIIRDFGSSTPASRTDARKNSRVTFALGSTSKEIIEQQVNAKKPLSLEITDGLFQKGDNTFVDQVKWEKGTYPLANNGRVVQVEITKVEDPRAKTFDEARGQVIADYQNYLEKQWIEKLRKQYPVSFVDKEIEALKVSK